MTRDTDNPVLARCAAGIAIEGTPAEAHRLFEEAWAMRRDDYDACVAAHYLARHQLTAAARLEWNVIAARHAEAVQDGRADNFFPSLYLNLADAYAGVGRLNEARAMVAQARATLPNIVAGGYRAMIKMGIERLVSRIDAAQATPAAP